MGFVSKADFSLTSQAIISTFFRMPSATRAAAIAHYNSIDDNANDQTMRGIVPLVIVGDRSTYTNSETGTLYGSPTVFGIRCGLRSNLSEPYPVDGSYLFARLQYASGSNPNYPPGTTGPAFYEVGGMSSQAGGVISVSEGFNESLIEVTPDVWHHALWAFNMSGSSHNFGSTCKFWMAYDDQNYSGDYLTPYGANCYPWAGGDPNGIISNWDMLGGSFGAGNLPSGVLGIGGHSGFSDNVYAMDRGPTMIITGVSADLSNQAIRRLFIDNEGKPVDPSAAIDYFGKNPEVAFYTADAWITGEQTGTFGSFAVTGTPTKTTPNPQIGA